MTTATASAPVHTNLNTNVLTPEQVAFYKEHGYLHIPEMFSAEETAEMSEHLNWLIDVWAMKDAGWTGPWRKKYMDAETEKKSKLIALHDLQYYSDAWSARSPSARFPPPWRICSTAGRSNCTTARCT